MSTSTGTSVPVSQAAPGEAAAGALDKAIDVLFHLHTEPTPKGVSEIGRALGLPKSSAHRLLATLTRRGLVDRDDRGRYRLGAALVSLGFGVLEREPLVAAARPSLEREARELGETCFLVVARAGRLIVVDKVEGTGFLRASPQVGAEVPAHATAVGKLYHALAPDLLAGPPGSGEHFTDRTLAEEAFAREVERAARDGFAANHNEWIEGLSVLAVPVVVHGSLRGAIALAAANARIEALGGEGVVERLRAAAADTEARLTLAPRELAGAAAGRSASTSPSSPLSGDPR